MTPREVFDAMRPFYPDWPRDYESASVYVQQLCYVMGRHPERLRAWLAVKEPARPDPPILDALPDWRTPRQRAAAVAASVSQSKRIDAARQIDRKRLASGERENEE